MLGFGLDIWFEFGLVLELELHVGIGKHDDGLQLEYFFIIISD